MYIQSSSIAEQALSLEKRYSCYYVDSRGNCVTNRSSYSAWYSWGRFVVLGVVILILLVLFVGCACVTARRRRARGATPYYGTGWMANSHGPVNYYGNQPQQGYGYNSNNQAGYGGAPPQYQYGQSASYYGNRGQETGVELQSPPATYGNTYQQAGDNVYQPPPGPPPGKTADGFIR